MTTGDAGVRGDRTMGARFVLTGPTELRCGDEAGAARKAGCHRGGSSRPPPECRCVATPRRPCRWRPRSAAGAADRCGPLEANDVEDLLAAQPERLSRLPVVELQGQDPHPDQVRTMDALERFGEDGPDAKESGAFGRPVP